MSMGIENMTAEEVRGAQRLLLAMCGAAFVALAKTLFEVSAEVGVAPEEVPEEEPEDVPEEDGSDEGDEGDEEDGGDEEYEEDEPEEKPRRHRGPAITDEELLDWVEKRDEGIPITEIARTAGRGIAVVCRKLKEYDSAQLDAARDAEDAEDEEDQEDEEE